MTDISSLQAAVAEAEKFGYSNGRARATTLIVGTGSAFLAGMLVTKTFEPHARVAVYIIACGICAVATAGVAATWLRNRPQPPRSRSLPPDS